MSVDLDGKALIVTGGASGIGAAFVKLASDAGARVLALDVQQSLLDKLADDLSDGPGEVSTRVVDVADSSAVEQAVRAAVDAFGRIDGCFNNAGIAPNGVPTPDTPDELFERVMHVNAFGCFYVLKHTLKVMRDQKAGAIVNTASTAGLRGLADYAPYVISKHGVLGLTKAAALEAAPYGVRINAVCPGFTETPIYDELLEPVFHGDREAAAAARATWASNIPAGRFGRAEEVAAVAGFLLSDDASYVNGEAVLVDGAHSAGFYTGG